MLKNALLMMPCCAGDDMVPRASPSSLKRMEKRLVEYVPQGEEGTVAATFDYARSAYIY